MARRLRRLLCAAACVLAAAPALAQPLVYVTDASAGTVTAVDSGTNTVVRQLTNFSGPEGVAISADGTRIYVAESSSGAVAVLDGTKIRGTQNPLIKEITVGGEPVALALSPDGQTLYVADAQNDQALAVDLSSGTVTTTYGAGSGVRSLALSPDGHLLAIGANDKTLTLYARPWQGTTSAKKTIVNLGAVPKAMTFDAAGRTLWIATGAGFASYDRVTGATTSHTLSGGTNSVAYDVRQNLVYFGTGSAHIVYSYTPGGNGVGQIGVYDPVSGLALSADGTRLYAVQNCQNCGIAVINAVQGQAITQVHFGTAPATPGRFAGPGAIHAQDAVLDGQADEQASGSVSATDEQGRSLSYAVLAAPTQGQLSLSPAGDFVYTPPASYSGLQSFVWQASAASGEGSPTQPRSRPITESLAIFPTLGSIADQNTDPDTTLGSLTLTLSGSVPLTLTVTSTNQDVVNPAKVTFSPGCGTTSLDCTLSVPVGSAGGSTANVTVSATDPSGLAGTTSFKVTTSGSNFGGGSLGGIALALLAGAALLFAVRKRKLGG